MESSALRELYQQIILDHAKEKHGYGIKPDSAASSRQVNPTCGDEITLHVHHADGVVTFLSWEGQGCSISTASASILSDLLTEVSDADAHQRIDAFRELMQSHGASEPDPEVLGDAVVLSGVARYVTRIKCAMLPWVAFEHALAEIENGA